MIFSEIRQFIYFGFFFFVCVCVHYPPLERKKVDFSQVSQAKLNCTDRTGHLRELCLGLAYFVY